MKKTEKISIASISFTFDNDAYLALKQYIDSLNNYYGSDPDGREIIADIEARIAELILGEQVYTKIVSKPLVNRIVAQLGAPEEFDAQDGDETGGAGARAATGTGRTSPADASIPRRLYRSGDRRILGGVCGGMSQFWNIDVTWLRLGFLVPLILLLIFAPFGDEDPVEFFGGLSWTFAVLYIVLWIALPKAKTPRQKLEARGERITPSSIRQSFQEGATTPSAKKAASVAAEIFAVFGRIMLFFIKLMVAIFGFSLLIAALGILVAIITVLVAPTSLGFLTFLSGLAILSPVLFVALVLFCVMIPFFVVGMGLLSLVFSWKPGRIFFGITLGVWLLAMIFCSVVLASNARYLRNEIRDHKGIIEWFDDWCDDDRKGVVYNFLKEEDNGLNNITINIARDSIEVVSWRDDTADSTFVSPDGMRKYNRRIVIRDDKIERGQDGRIDIHRIP